MKALRNPHCCVRNWVILLQEIHHITQRTLVIILSVEFIFGSLGNGFIALVNCMDWVKRRNLSSVDEILTALALSRIGVLCSVFIGVAICLQHPTLCIPGTIVRVINITWTVTNHFSVWLATSLSIFYFLKIANFSNPAFLYLKRRVKKVVSATLLVSVVLLCLNIVMMNIWVDTWIGGHKGNLSYSSGWREFEQLSRINMIINTAFLSAPFAVSLMTFLLLIFSLWKHAKRMQHRARGSRDVSTAVHVKVLQTVIAFLLLYTIFFLSLIVQFWIAEFLGKSLVLLFCLTVTLVFPSGHSFVLILGNRKLRQAYFLVLWWLRCRFKDVESSGP